MPRKESFPNTQISHETLEVRFSPALMLSQVEISRWDLDKLELIGQALRNPTPLLRAKQPR